MNEQQLMEQLTRETPVLPDVDVTSLEAIEGIAHRRSEVRHQLLAFGCLLIGAAFVGVMSRRSNDAVAQANSNTSETTERNVPRASASQARRGFSKQES